MKSGQRFVILVVLMSSTVVCHAESAPPKVASERVPNEGDAAAGQVPSLEQAIAAARAWLDDLKANDRTQIKEHTNLPFLYVTTSRKKVCDGTATDVAKLTSLIDCLTKRDKIFVEELAQAGKLRLKNVEPAQIPPSLAKVVGKPAARERLVSTFINGDGITFEIVLAIAVREGTSSAGVRAVFLNAEVESG